MPSRKPEHCAKLPALPKLIPLRDYDTIRRTLAIIKPDAVSRAGLVGEILTRIHAAGFQISAIKSMRLTRAEAEGFYDVHRRMKFFEPLTQSMSSGKIFVMVLEGEDVIVRWRQMMGATDPAKAAPGTLRQQYGTDVQHNVVHGSDSPETVAIEVNYFFSDYDLT